MKVVFLISLPRAGSTLLQRLLMTHPQIASCGEPWLALPLVQMFKAGESFSTYGHASLVRSGKHLSEQLPRGSSDLLTAGGHFLSEIYEKLSDSDSKYFLDKTPRYYKIIPELMEMLPDARFILLRREPIAVFASITNYIEGQMHLLPTWEQDIVEGIPKIGAALQNSSGRMHLIDYESIIAKPNETLIALLNFLGLDPSGLSINDLVRTHVPRGDPTGVKKFSTISQASLDSWKDTLSSMTKKRIALKWFRQISESDFKAYGYNKAEQLDKICALNGRLALKDELAWLTGKLYFNYQLNVVRWGYHRRRDGRSCQVY